MPPKTKAVKNLEIHKTSCFYIQQPHIGFIILCCHTSRVSKLVLGSRVVEQNTHRILDSKATPKSDHPEPNGKFVSLPSLWKLNQAFR